MRLPACSPLEMGRGEFKLAASPASPGWGWVGLAEVEASVLSQLGQEEVTLRSWLIVFLWLLTCPVQVNVSLQYIIYFFAQTGRICKVAIKHIHCCCFFPLKAMNRNFLQRNSITFILFFRNKSSPARDVVVIIHLPTAFIDWWISLRTFCPPV